MSELKQSGDILMSNEKEHKAKLIGDLGPLAIGNIGPRNEAEKLIAIKMAKSIDEYYQALTFYRWRCVDGRPQTTLSNELCVDTAGGVMTFAAADALGPRLFLLGTDNSVQHLQEVISNFENRDEIGGHCADHVANPDCDAGCGACDKFGEIINFIANNGQGLKVVAESLAPIIGLDFSQQLHDRIISNSCDLRARRYASTGKNLVQTIKESGSDDNAVEELEGDHKELIVVLNTQSDMVLNRTKLSLNFSESQAFAVDMWAILKTNSNLYLDGTQQLQANLAAFYYNLATAFVLSNKDLQVIVR